MFFKGFIKRIENIEIQIKDFKDAKKVFDQTEGIYKHWNDAIKDGKNPMIIITGDGDKFVQAFEKYMEIKDGGPE